MSKFTFMLLIMRSLTNIFRRRVAISPPAAAASSVVGSDAGVVATAWVP
jgi:hypothetical protein